MITPHQQEQGALKQSRAWAPLTHIRRRLKEEGGDPPRRTKSWEEIEWKNTRKESQSSELQISTHLLQDWDQRTRCWEIYPIIDLKKRDQSEEDSNEPNRAQRKNTQVNAQTQEIPDRNYVDLGLSPHRLKSIFTDFFPHCLNWRKWLEAPWVKELSDSTPSSVCS